MLPTSDAEGQLLKPVWFAPTSGRRKDKIGEVTTLEEDAPLVVAKAGRRVCSN